MSVRPPAESKLVHLCLSRARTAEGLADQLAVDVEVLRGMLDGLVKAGRLRRANPAGRVAYRASDRRASDVTPFERRRDTAASRMNEAVARVALRERVRRALDAEALTRDELVARFGLEVEDALTVLVAAREVAESDGRYRRMRLAA